MGGAVDYSECQRDAYNRCTCAPFCALCGNRKHCALHGPLYQQPPGSMPWGHEYQPTKPVLSHGRLCHDMKRYEVVEAMTMLPNETLRQMIERGLCSGAIRYPAE